MKLTLRHSSLSLSILACMLLVACASEPKRPIPLAAVSMDAVDGSSIRGQISFSEPKETKGVLRVMVDVTGLTQREQGLHVMEADNCRAAVLPGARHFNPDGKLHGQHAGDLPNVQSDIYGTMRGPLLSRILTVSGKYSIVGHAIVITALPDDFSSQPEGSSGPVVACGVILPL
ncbi:MAG TPA: superoxide dismutase family protein [Rhodocyclaceae bacterium]|nr:superoxide dismutase family protein [Rhodocyclaceae bacterium]